MSGGRINRTASWQAKGTGRHRPTPPSPPDLTLSLRLLYKPRVFVWGHGGWTLNQVRDEEGPRLACRCRTPVAHQWIGGEVRCRVGTTGEEIGSDSGGATGGGGKNRT